MIKGYKVRIYPNKTQVALIEQNFGACRWLYNRALALKRDRYEQYKDNLSVYEISKMLTFWKKTDELNWLKIPSTASLQQCLLQLDKAYKGFFKGNGYPKFKNKHNEQSFSVPMFVSFKDNKIKFLKLGLLKYKGPSALEGKIKTCTISRVPSGKYFMSMRIDNGKELPKLGKIKNAVGIDLGLNNFIALSDGRKVDNPRYFKIEKKRLIKAQKRLSKKVKGSKNRLKQRIRVAKIHEWVNNRRSDFLHKLSHSLVSENQTDTFILESLNVKGMVRNHALAGSIADASWAEFIRMMSYKAAWVGKRVIFIDRFAPSSKLCSQCGYKNETLTLGERAWECPQCGVPLDRDINAALNIKYIGINTARNAGIDACGDHANRRVDEARISANG
jgi:putative transposase